MNLQTAWSLQESGYVTFNDSLVIESFHYYYPNAFL